ncbi:hypothetical protein P3W45_001104 [Vairimorpha bombi]|jgi:hypothetical protein
MLTVFLLINCTKIYNQDSTSLQNKIEFIRSAGKDDPINSLKALAKLISEENIKLKHVYESILCTNQSDIDTKIQRDNEIIKEILIYIFHSKTVFIDIVKMMSDLYLDIKYLYINSKKRNVNQIEKDLDEVKRDIDKWEEAWNTMKEEIRYIVD